MLEQAYSTCSPSSCLQNFKTNIINKQNNYVQMTVQLCVVFDCDDYLMGFKLKNNTNL